MRELAALVCVAFVAFLFWRDVHKEDAERISWAPFFWMAIAGSRFVSAWLHLQSPGTVDAYSEGSPLDRVVFFALILWGTVVLYRRKIDWREFLAQNKWIVVYFLYCLASVAWTDDSLVLAKRWVKDLGNPIMALVMLTERRHYDALVITARRLAFLFFPVSLLFIRYFPEFGRSYSNWGGVSYSGVADQKNTLGLSCLLIGICYAWSFIYRRKLIDRFDIALGVLLAWLLYTADSQTSLMCLVVALALLSCSTLKVMSRRPTRIVVVTLCSAALYLTADQMFNVQDYLLPFLGRNPTLTNRTDVWAILRTFQTNALVGAGFMSFWTGDRMDAIWKAVGGRINQAHNGYLEQYLNLGYVGVAFIFAIATSALISVRKHMRTDYPVGLLRLCLLVIAMIYNYAEASFYGINNMWVLFLAASVSPPTAWAAEAATARAQVAQVPALRRFRSRLGAGRRPGRVTEARPPEGRVPELGPALVREPRRLWHARSLTRRRRSAP